MLSKIKELTPKMYKSDKVVLGLIFIITTLSIFALFHENNITHDESNYLLLGKTILQGQYPYDFIHRLPVVPLFVAGSLSLGFEIITARLMISVIFMNLALFATFFLVKTLYGRKSAILSSIALFSCFAFWRWGLFTLVDVPLTCFILSFILFFYLGIEKDKKYLYLASLSLVLSMLTKTASVLIIPGAFAYLTLRKKLKVFFEKEFILDLITIPVVWLSVYFLFSVLTGASADITGEFITQSSGFPWDISPLLKMMMFPVLIFIPFGISLRKKEDRLVLLSILSFMIFFLLSGHLRIRYLLPVIPLLCILSANGFLSLRKKLKKIPGIIITLIFAFLLGTGFVNSIYMVQIDEGMEWGANELAKQLSSLRGTILTEFMPDYLKAELDNEIINLDIITKNISAEEFFGFVKSNRISYFVMSIYSEYYNRGFGEEYFPMTFLGFEIPLIERPYSNGRVPPDYTFRSEFYKSMESSGHFKNIKEIYNNHGQKVLIIYETVS